MKFIYLLWHTHSNEALSTGEDVKLVGVYTSKENAKMVQARAEQLEGFKDHLDGFKIPAIRLIRMNGHQAL